MVAVISVDAYPFPGPNLEVATKRLLHQQVKILG